MTANRAEHGKSRHPATPVAKRPPAAPKGTPDLSLRYVPPDLYEPPAFAGDDLFDWTAEEMAEPNEPLPD